MLYDLELNKAVKEETSLLGYLKRFENNPRRNHMFMGRLYKQS